MRVAGIGLRRDAGAPALLAALEAAGGLAGLDALATIEEKAPALSALAAGLGLPVRAVPAEALRGQETATRSPRILARHGTGSLAEAAALFAAGPRARLLAPRAVSSDGMATAAIAEGDGP